MLLKRAFDLLVSLGLIVVLAPVLVLIVLAVRIDSPGPVIYKGLRAGRGGRPFRILKFRSMVVDTERIGGGTTALNDPRVTAIGAFLRRFKLDELPQLFNVVNGEMSIVGPRPELLQYTSRYTVEEACILSVRPGITDLSSLEFSSLQDWVGEQDADRVFEERILPRKNALRVEYVRNRSFWLDMKIIGGTFLKVVSTPFARGRSHWSTSR